MTECRNLKLIIQELAENAKVIDMSFSKAKAAA